MILLKNMTTEQQITMYKDLLCTSMAINSGRNFLQDLKTLQMAETLTDHVESEIKDFESTMKSSLYYINDNDRIAIMSHAFNQQKSIKLQTSLECDSSYYEKDLQALDTLIDLNNQTMFVKYGIQAQPQQQASLALLPQDQLQSFSTFLSDIISKTDEETNNQGAFDNQMRLSNLYLSTTNILEEMATATSSIEQN